MIAKLQMDLHSLKHFKQKKKSSGQKLVISHGYVVLSRQEKKYRLYERGSQFSLEPRTHQCHWIPCPVVLVPRPFVMDQNNASPVRGFEIPAA